MLIGERGGDVSLTDTGARVETLSGVNAEAHNGLGATVVISATHEAIQDYGWGAIFKVASAKYDAGKTEPNSNPPLVRVTTGDLGNASRS